MIKSVVFDVGGVLIRTEDQTGRRILEERLDLEDRSIDRLVFGSPEAAASTIGKMDADAIWTAVGARLGLSEDEIDDFVDLFWQGDVFDQQLFDYLVSLRSNYVTGILSNAWKGAREVFADRFGVVEGETVDHILVSCELGLAKPEVAIYQQLRETVGVDFNEILFVDDFTKNVEAAKALGIVTIHYQPGMDLIDQINSMLA
ncbi:MAG: HAD family phosphatase [Chloroflexota bacterium]|nr:HAD family phosphatase [Chloroflexota bacterium]